jgi:hypothetical protein
MLNYLDDQIKSGLYIDPEKEEIFHLFVSLPHTMCKSREIIDAIFTAMDIYNLNNCIECTLPQLARYLVECCNNGNVTVTVQKAEHKTATYKGLKSGSDKYLGRSWILRADNGNDEVVEHNDLTSVTGPDGYTRVLISTSK